jgi:hypothetical protein
MLTARLYQIARVTHVVNGVRRQTRSPAARRAARASKPTAAPVSTAAS